MKCSHCSVEFHSKAQRIEFTHRGRESGPNNGVWAIERYLCPNPQCARPVSFLVFGREEISPITLGRLSDVKGLVKRILYNPNTVWRPLPPGVPAECAEDYSEACAALPVSPKAAAALSKRCLQTLLRKTAKVKPGSLGDEIQQLIDSKTLPSHLVQSIDAIRNIGNFAAHPIKNEKSGEVVGVEPGDAEWNLDVLDSLFDFYFVQPALAEKRHAPSRELAEAKAT